MSDMFRIDGKVALVTGATSGIGQAIAVALAEAGADVAGVGSSGRFADVSQAVQRAGQRFHGITADLADPDAPARVVDEAVTVLGRLNILVNNAGIVRRKAAIDFTAEDWDVVLDLNLKAPFLLAQLAARSFVEGKSGGKIINIASMLSFQGGILVPSYAAAKSGLAGLTKALANEWAPWGINVNAIAPGYIATRVTDSLQKDPVRNKAILDRIPAGRWGTPSDLGGMAVFLASPVSDYCHGGIYPVDGGWLAR